MSLGLILQALQAGITNGFIYALVGMGLAVIFRGSRVINVMHGEFSVVAAMVTVLLLSFAHYPYWFAILAGVLTGPAIGAVIELILVRPMIAQQATEDQFVLLDDRARARDRRRGAVLHRPRRLPAARLRRRPRVHRLRHGDPGRTRSG